METYNITIISSFIKKRINSKRWDLIGTDYIRGIPELITEPKFKTEHRVITNIPQLVDIEDVYSAWRAVDMTMAPLFFRTSSRLGISWHDLKEKTEKKLSGESDFCSVMLRPLANDYTGEIQHD